MDIVQIHQKYFGVFMEKRFFVFTVLPFGLCSACYIFAKLMHSMVRCWWSWGLRPVEYINNGLYAKSGMQPACSASQLVFQTLDQAGFAVHPVMSVRELTQRLVSL